MRRVLVLVVLYRKRIFQRILASSVTRNLSNIRRNSIFSINYLKTEDSTLPISVYWHRKQPEHKRYHSDWNSCASEYVYNFEKPFRTRLNQKLHSDKLIKGNNYNRVVNNMRKTRVPFFIFMAVQKGGMYKIKNKTQTCTIVLSTCLEVGLN